MRSKDRKPPERFLAKMKGAINAPLTSIGELMCASIGGDRFDVQGETLPLAEKQAKFEPRSSAEGGR